MKVLLINGSSNQKGCTFTALSEVAETLEKEGVETEIVQLGAKACRDCIACMACRKLDNKCVFDDDIVNVIIEKAKEADGFVFGSPVYYAHPTGRILSILDRVFFAASPVFKFKPGAAVVSARRAGTTAAIDVLNKYFTINNMPVVSSSYWNMVHGFTPDDVKQDLEGMQVMRQIGKNMAWLIKNLKNGKTAFNEDEEKIFTNFI
ncbi:MAG: flavodoxin family protein [Lactobacillaceae bacterium]|jgi:multimeric flavodoxin WrbA|nr:flavodoxin family protein [Lactobacillaceae bacterium]